MSETKKQATNSETVHKYTVAIKGNGGEFACIPLTAEQVDYWGERGDLALAAHISLRDNEDEDVPSEFQLPDFREQDWITGVGRDATLTVEDEEGVFRLEMSPDDEDFQEKLNFPQFSRKMGYLDGPSEQPVAMYRTVAQGADVYEVTTSQPFDLARLSFDCVDVSQWGDVISNIGYEGGQVELIDLCDLEYDDPLAVLLRK